MQETPCNEVILVPQTWDSLLRTADGSEVVLSELNGMPQAIHTQHLLQASHIIFSQHGAEVDTSEGQAFPEFCTCLLL